MEIERHNSIIEIDTVINELVRISREVSSLCHEKGWESDELETLRTELDSFSEPMKTVSKED
jgi:hypothetical protein